MAIDIRVSASKQVGKASEYQHYLKFKKDIEMGIVPKELIPDMTETDKKWSYLTYQPDGYVFPAWSCYWAIRRTKGHDYPVCHQDIYYYTQLMRVELSPSQVELVLMFDSKYYTSYQKHNPRG